MTERRITGDRPGVGEPDEVDHRALLALAERYVTDGGPRHIHMACWLGRQALEMLIAQFLTLVSADAAGWTARSRLAVLTVTFAGTPLPRNTRAAWENLSNACHLHAYELSPTPAEVRGWLEDVRSLADQHKQIAG